MNNQYYQKYNKKCHPVKTRHFVQKETSRIIGEATIGATIKIINNFNPKI
jgi:carbonic anhydrase/acetyltransferase-like protein (isoleucine patch superfamily)